MPSPPTHDTGSLLRRAGEAPPTTALVALGRGPFGVRLLLDDDGRPSILESGDPQVVRLGVEIHSATGRILGRGVLELPDVEGLRGSSESGLRSQDDLETAWRDRRSELEKMQGEGSGARILLPASDREQLPPLVSTPEGCFALPCPSCHRPLVTCRDRELLGRLDLPSPREGLDVFLVCPQGCGSRSAEGEGEDAEGEDAGKSKAEKSEAEKSKAEKSKAEKAETEGGAAPGGEPRLFIVAREPSDAEAGAGCLGLEDLRSLLATAPPGDAADAPPLEGEWHVVSDRELPFLLLETRGGALDGFADLLGGRVAGEAEAPPSDRYLLAFQGSGLDAIEILTLKLVLFRQVLGAVAAYHRILGRPHLDLHPGHFVVDPLSESGPGLPSLWSFQCHLLGNSGARPRQLSPGVRWVGPPERPRTPYASPLVRRACLVKPEVGELVAERVVDDEGRFRLEAKLSDPNGLFPRPGEHDWVRVRLRRQGVGDVRELLVRLDPRSFGDSGPLSVTSEPFELDAKSAERWREMSKVELGEVEYRVFPSLGFEADHYALGMFLLRLLLVDDQQDLGTLESELEADLRRARHGLEEGAEDSGDLEEEMARLVGDILADHPHLFGPDHVFWHRHERREDRPNAIPKGVWEEAMGFALRWLITSADGGGEPLPLDSSGGPLARFDDLLRRCRTLMFRLQPVHLEVHSVVAEMLTSLD